MTTEQIIFAVIQTVINSTIFFFIIKSNTVIKERLKSQDDINQKMKSLMDIFSVDEVKKFVELRTESMQLQLDNHLKKEQKKFAENAKPYIREMIGEGVDKVVDNMQSKYDELCEASYNFILTIPADQRLEYLNKNFPLTKDEFIEELKNYNELPNI